MGRFIGFQDDELKSMRWALRHGFENVVASGYSGDIEQLLIDQIDEELGERFNEKQEDIDETYPDW